MRRSELKEMVKKLQESWQQLRKLMELEMQKWYLPIKKKITWPVKKIFQKRKMQERKNKILQQEEVKNEIESIPMIVLTSSNKEDMVKIAIEEFSYHSEVFEPCVQNEKVEVHVYKKVSNDDGSDFFFKSGIYIFSKIL